jgi:hypothetical protein
MVATFQAGGTMIRAAPSNRSCAANASSGKSTFRSLVRLFWRGYRGGNSYTIPLLEPATQTDPFSEITLRGAREEPTYRIVSKVRRGVDSGVDPFRNQVGIPVSDVGQIAQSASEFRCGVGIWPVRYTPDRREVGGGVSHRARDARCSVRRRLSGAFTASPLMVREGSFS